MRTAAAYTAKLKAEALGRTYKVQDTNHRLFTTTLYRGAAGCGPVNYTQIDYVPICECKYIGPAKGRTPDVKPGIYTIVDGGNPFASGITIFDGGSPASSGRLIVDGGI